MLASMLAVSLIFALQAEVTAQSAGSRQEQAWATALSGVARAIAVAQAPTLGLVDTSDNPAAFQHQLVAEDGDDRWYFSLYSHSEALSGEPRFGLTDEAGKLPLPHTDPTWIARLPRLDESLARALTSGRPPTAEPEASANLSPETDPTVPPGTASATTNRPPATPTPNPAGIPAITLEEAFARAGLAGSLLQGEDANFNLHLDPNEDDGETTPPLDDRNGLLDPGLRQFLTTDSYDLDVDSEGRPRLNLNDPAADLAPVGLPQSALDYLAALRRAGRKLAHPVELLGAEDTLPDASGKTVPMRSGIGRDEIATVLDRCTTSEVPRLEGLVNINTAPAAVLAALPALGESGADAVLSARPGLGVEERRTPAWLLVRGILDANQFKELAPRLTTRGFQFSFHCVGYAVPSGRYRVLAATIDVAPRPARILAIRDLTRFGFPLPLELLETTEF
jgi:hypothetical protein